MKQHSYAYYNGYLSEAYKTRQTLQTRLEQLEETAPARTPSATTPAVLSLATSYLDSKPTTSELSQRRKSESLNDNTTDIARIAAAIGSGEPLDLGQIQTFKRIIKWEIDALTEDVRGKCSSNDKAYPHNLTMKNHYEYIILPTLVYELEYPRTDNINWEYVVEKGAATAGILVVMMLVSQTFIYPVVVAAVEMKEAGMSLQARLEAFPWILSDLIFPFMMEYMASISHVSGLDHR
jgi:sterol O-acyltransferase